MNNLPASIKNDPRYAGKLTDLFTPDDIPQEWRDTPIEKLIAAENFRKPIPAEDVPQLLIATCIEYRYALPIPRMYAYVIRRASGRLIGSEFSVAYVLSKGVRHIAMIGHNDCGMTKVPENRQSMIDTLIEQGWNPERAEEYIDYQAGRHAICNEIDAMEKEYLRLQRLFRKVMIAPLFACLSDTRLYVPTWYSKYSTSERTFATQIESVRDEDILAIT